MGVAAQQDFGVGEFEAQLLDRRPDLRHGIVEIAVDQDISLRRRDQEGTEIVGADKVDVPDYLIGGKGLVERFMAAPLRQYRQSAEQEARKNLVSSHRGGQSITFHRIRSP